MKKHRFFKALAAMAAAALMTCTLALGVFADNAPSYSLSNATLRVGQTYTFSAHYTLEPDIPEGDYTTGGPSRPDTPGVLKYVSASELDENGVRTYTYQAMMPGTCTINLRSSFKTIASATITVTDGSTVAPTADAKTSADISATDSTAAPAADTRTEQQKQIDEAKANGTWGSEYTTCTACGTHNWTRVGEVYVCDNCGHETTSVKGPDGVKGYVGGTSASSTAQTAPQTRYASAAEAQTAADQREAAYAAAVAALQRQVAQREAAYLAAAAK